MQCNPDQNSNDCILKNALENVVCEMKAILSRPQCVKYRRSKHQDMFTHGIGL